MDIQLVVDIAAVAALMVLGLWLERVGGMDGTCDELLTPFPLGCAGVCLMFVERLGV